MRPYMYKAYQSSFNIEKYVIFLKTTHLRLCFRLCRLLVFPWPWGGSKVNDIKFMSEVKTFVLSKVREYNMSYVICIAIY